MTKRQTRGWGALLFQWGKDIQLLLYVVATLFAFRLVLIALFQDQGQFALGDLGHVVFVGLRFDLSTAALWVAPTFLLSLLVVPFALGSWMERLRRRVAGIYVAVAMLTFGADLVFFGEYNDQFEQHIFGIAYDDTRAILITIWKNYHPIPVLLAVVGAIALNLRLVRRWLDYSPAPLMRLATATRVPSKGVATLVLFFLFVALARGGTLWGEPILLKHAFVVDDLFLNRTVVNPFTALHAAVETKWRASQSGGLEAFWPSGDLRAAARQVRASRGLEPTEVNSVDEGLLVHARGRQGPTPKHLFVILMESHDGWPVLPRYRHLGFSPGLASLADGGLYFPNFLPASDGTIGSLTAMITGMPVAGVQVNYEASSLSPYPSSLAATFKRLGYRTRFFYGGYLGWQRLDTFALGQGFDEVWGGGSMAKGNAPTNEWGVADQYIYDFMLQKVEEDATPSLNFVLTTSNHPPYDLDLDAQGFPVKQLPEGLTPTKSDTLKVLGHLWYADREVARFVEEAHRRHPESLFAITGDHTTRLNIRFGKSDSVFESVAVPLVLYGPQVLKDRRADPATPGSHLDIPPTLVELCAPAGFPYYTFGRDLLRDQPHGYGFGPQFIVGRDFIATDAKEAAVYGLPGGPRPPLPADFGAARTTYNALKALSWQRVRNGSHFPPQPATE